MAENNKKVFCWYGDNSFDIAQMIRQWTTVFEKKFTGLNVVKLDAQDLGQSKGQLIQELKNALQVNSLFGANKLIILRNFLLPSIEKNQELKDLIQSALEKVAENFFVILWQVDKPDARTKVFKSLQALEKKGQAEIKEFQSPRGYQLDKWVNDIFNKNKYQVEPRAVELLIALVGSDLWQINTEIEKLINYRKGEIIRADDVKQLVKARFNDDIFQLMDALSRRDKAMVLKLMADQLDSGASEMYVFAMLVRQFRLLWQVKELLVNEGIRDKVEIARKLKLHPFVVQKILEQHSKFDFLTIKKIYRRLLEFESALKSERVGFRVLFDNFLASI